MPRVVEMPAVSTDAPRRRRTVLMALLSVALGVATLILIVRSPGLPQFYAGPIVMCVISAAYFVASARDAPRARRIVTSAHGLVAAIMTLGAIAMYASGNSRPIYGPPFLFLYLIPLGLAGASLFSYPGPKIMHVLQGPNVAAMVWSAFIGGMAASGDWL